MMLKCVRNVNVKHNDCGFCMLASAVKLVFCETALQGQLETIWDA